MPKKLSQQIIDNVIDKRLVVKGIQIEFWDLNGTLINSTLYEDIIKQYSFNLSKKFAAASATIVLKNENGEFSPDNEFAIIKKGYTISIKEHFSDYPSIKFDRFYGTVKQINPLKTSSGNTVEITCYDSLIKLQQTDLEKVFESSEKEFIENDLLDTNPLPEPRDHLSQVFDGNYAGWALLPPPTISITLKGTSQVASTKTDGFEINYKSGQVILNQALNTEDFDVKATYHYFKRGLFAEDIIKDILLEPDDFGNTVFESSEITSTLNQEESVTTDTLIPVTSPINLSTQLAIKKESTDTEVHIYRFDTWKFINTHKFKIGDDEFQYNGKSDVTVGGIEMTKLLNVTGTHTNTILRGEALSVFYDIGENRKTRVWRTTYNNITDAVVSTDFTITGASFQTFDTRTGLLLLDTQILPNSSVVLNKNYNFITIQASGIEIPYMRLSKRTHSNRLEAIKRELLPLLPPNYVLLSRGTQQIWGMLLNQKPEDKEDFELKLNKQIQYVTDQEVFSRVFLRGRNNNPHNIMLDESTKMLGMNEFGLTFNSFATDQPIRIPEHGNYSRDYYPFSIYRMKDQRYSWLTDKMLIYSSWVEDSRLQVPVVKIDGVAIGSEIQRKSRVPIALDEHVKENYSYWGPFRFREDDTYSYTVRTSQRALLPPILEKEDTHMVFFDRDGRVMEYRSSPLVIKKSNTTNMDVHSFDLIHNDGYTDRTIGRVRQAEDYSYMDMNFSDWFVKTIGFVSYGVLLPEKINGKTSWYLSGSYFWVHRDLLQFQVFHNVRDIPQGVDYIKTNYFRDGGSLKVAIYSNITASFRYRSVVAQFDEPENLKDGDADTETQLMFFNETGISGQPAFVVDFQRNVRLQAMDIIGGKFYPYKELDKGFSMDCEYSLTLQCSNSLGVATLISDASPSSTFLRVLPGQTAKFPDSGLAFLGDDSFSYTGKTNDTFTGVTGLSETHDIGYEYVTDPETGASHRRYRRVLILSERFSNISQEASNIRIKSGDAITLDKSQIGEQLQCRMIRAVVDHIEPVEYARRTIAYPVSIASFNVYEDVEFESNAKLSPTTALSTGFSTPPSTLQVKDTSLFPASGTAYLSSDKFTYTGKTATSFTGVSGLTEGHFTGAYVTQEDVWNENSLFVRDPINLLKEVSDKVYKERGVQQKLITQEDLNKRAKNLLAEFYKNHNKVRIDNVFTPYAYVGQTVKLADKYTDQFEIDRNYFIESIMCNNGNYSMELAYYP